MQKFSALLLILFYSSHAVSQIDIDLGLKSKMDFISIKSLTKNDRQNIEEYFITDSDTLVSLKNELSKSELDVFCKCFTNDSLIRNYKSAVFYYSNNNDKVQKANQWNSNLKVYFSKDIPKKTRNKFKKFYKPISSINNLKIDFVKDIEDSNYVIKLSDTIIPNITIGETEYDETHPLSKISYSLLIDKYRKYYGGTLIVDVDRLNNKNLLLPKLKQLFFLSLGAFIINKSFSNTSLISTEYIDNRQISNEDLKLLEMHYFIIYDKLVSAFTINELAKNSKSICSYE